MWHAYAVFVVAWLLALALVALLVDGFMCGVSAMVFWAIEPAGRPKW